MKNKVLVYVLMVVLLLAAVNFPLAPRASAADEYDGLRDKWKVMLTGGTSIATADPDIAAKITALTDEAQSYWDTLNTAAGRTNLWSDLTGTTNSAYVTSAYSRLRSMALAYATTGSSLQNNASLLTDLKSALDWMYTNRYNETTTKYNNWWDWEIGAPLYLNDISVLLYDQLSSAQLTNYMNAINHFQPTVTMTGANRVWESMVIGVRGILVKDSTKLAASRDGLSNVFTYVTSGDGVYADGSFIQHTKFAYTGGYGSALISDIADLLYLLDGSTWAVTNTNKQNVYKWVYSAFEPLVYKGLMMDMTRGRNISRSYNQDHAAGKSVIEAVIRLSQTANATDAAAFKSMVKYWINADTYSSFYESAAMNLIVLAKAIMADSSVISRGELVKHKNYNSMDRDVHLRPGFGFGISMSSSRIYNYESINSENVKGWYTGDGMTYLYNSDLGQFSDDFWPTVNPYRLPGTTVDTQTRSNSSGQSYVSSKNWVGGTEVIGTYGVQGMELDAYNSTLTGKKSWFMFDDEVVALGSGITSTDGRPIETIVENRKLNASGSNALTVNGTAKSTTVGWSETMSGVNWAHLAGSVAGSDIGYYFPGSATVKGLRESRTGAWSVIDRRAGIPTTPITSKYLNLVLDHGTNPTNSTYAYVLLPGKTSAQVSDYASSPTVSILENSGDAQAVKETALNVTGVNFWNDAVKTSGGITSNKKASVMMSETSTDLDVSVVDPTQANAGTISIEINKSALGVVSADSGVTVTQLSPTIKFSVNVAGAKGKTFKVKFSFVTAGGGGGSVALPFQDNFESGTADAWATSGGSWSVVTSGATKVYKQATQAGTSMATAGDPAWSDYTVEAAATPLSFAGSGSYIFGLMARYADANNRYAFQYGNGNVSIVKKVAGTSTTLVSKAYTVTAGTPYTFKAVLSGNQLDFYINGVKELSTTDSTFVSGSIGLLTYGATAQFDNVVAVDLPVTDDFEDGNASGWTPDTGSWSVITDGATKMYKQSTTSSNGMSATGNSAWQNYSVTAKIKPNSLAGSGSNVVGLALRQADANNRYNFVFASGTLQIGKRVGGVTTTLVSEPYTIATGTSYTMQAVVAGSTLKLYVNGVLELTTTDTALTQGGVGLITYNAAASFDDVAIVY
ncbi:polysaccharide lyase family 8 super-sandwich domain-containing protein [Paenibacillus oryzisoli]|uniref:polysaccharide lyase family 8 super-sandwich domain-containing protein n=1 Tax=Paenibacillus oryzisoli TaxID=1850517 RepID=UPI003D2797F0